MRKYVLTYGLLLGLLLSASMIFMVFRCYNNADFAGNDSLGHLFIFGAHLLVFVGAQQYRNKAQNGLISFGQAFSVAALIALAAATLYVITWLFAYYLFVPDFMDVYASIAIKKAEMEGGDIATTTQQVEQFKEWYKNPVLIILLTYMEVFPIGLVVALVSALILRRAKA